MDFLSYKNWREWLKGCKSLFKWVLKKLSLYEILVEFAIGIWNVFIFTLFIINIIILIFTVIIVGINRPVLAIFASVQTTTEICACQFSLPIVGTENRLVQPSLCGWELLWSGLFPGNQLPPSQFPEWADICLGEKELTEELFDRFQGLIAQEVACAKL